MHYIGNRVPFWMQTYEMLRGLLSTIVDREKDNIGKHYLRKALGRSAYSGVFRKRLFTSCINCGSAALGKWSWAYKGSYGV